jgi:hypothetical protein
MFIFLGRSSADDSNPVNYEADYGNDENSSDHGEGNYPEYNDTSSELDEFDDEAHDFDAFGEAESESSESSDITEAIDDEDDPDELQDSRPLLSTLLVIFFRIIHHFKISNNATTALLSFISFLLGMSGPNIS